MFRISVALAGKYVTFSQKHFPTNIVTRWMRRPGHLRYAWPLSIGLYFAYYGIARWIHALPATDTSGWLQLALGIASIDALKFASGVLVWPLLGAHRALRSVTSTAIGKYDARRTDRARSL